MEQQKIVLREYQKLAVRTGLLALKNSKKPVIMQACTAFGKSIVIANIVKELNEKTIVFQPSQEILEQNLAKYESYGYTASVFSASLNRKETEEKVIFSTIQSAYKYPELFKDVKYSIIDECFDGGVEILTDKGFKKFEDLDQTELVAQYDDGKIEFVKPLRYIKRKHNGEMIKINFSNYKNIRGCLMTPNHNQVYRRKISSDKYTINNCLVKDLTVGHSASSKNQLICAGKGTGNNVLLTDFERVLVALQADGSVSFNHNKKDVGRYSISLKKQRKKDRWKLLTKNMTNIKQLNITREGYEAWHILLGNDFLNKRAKYLSKCFNINMGYDRARDFIKEICLWDGTRKNEMPKSYSSIIKDNVDFVNAIATQAGYRTVMEQRERGNNRKTLYRVLFFDSDYRSLQAANKQIIQDYNNYVYCVEVPNHKIVVRSDGLTFVSGNCHTVNPQNTNGMYSKFFGEIKCSRVLSFSATPYRLVNRFCYEGGEKYYTGSLMMLNRIHPFFFGSIVYKMELKDLMEAGYIMKPEYIDYSNGFDLSQLQVNSTGCDYTEESVVRYTTREDRIKNTIKAVDEYFAIKNKILIITSCKQQASIIYETLYKKGYDVMEVYGDTPKKQRQEAIDKFKNNEKQILINVNALNIGFDCPSLDCIVNARQMMSLSLWIQAVGRLVRFQEGKKPVFVDCTKTYDKFGKAEDYILAKEDGFKDCLINRATGNKITGKALFSWKCKK